MKASLRTLVLLGVSIEILILLVSYLLYPEIGETFRYAARYSGRLSAIVYLYAFYQYARSFPTPIKDNFELRNFIRLFAILHIIHFGFLASNVFLNAIPLETVKVIGGALAYLMIVAAPFILHEISTRLQLVYFYYVGLVMILTYVARIKGDFEGAEPFWFHYLAISVLILSCIVFGLWIRKSSKQTAT